ncbi:hypothetical protein Meth11DRAFT_2122 [Methylophilaceae bacterium 11]|nr:hypothetical protein Meth11DRAFT_2122 [Methylophilaceae bacterium 11]
MAAVSYFERVSQLQAKIPAKVYDAGLLTCPTQLLLFDAIIEPNKDSQDGNRTFAVKYKWEVTIQEQTLWIISTLAAGTLIGIFLKMKPGFGPMSLSVMGIVLVAFLSSILAISNPDTLNAAMVILGAMLANFLAQKKRKKYPKKLRQLKLLTRHLEAIQNCGLRHK